MKTAVSVISRTNVLINLVIPAAGAVDSFFLFIIWEQRPIITV